MTVHARAVPGHHPRHPDRYDLDSVTAPRPRPLPVTPAHRPARAGRTAVLVLLVLVVLGLAAAGPTPASAAPAVPSAPAVTAVPAVPVAPAQDPETTTTAPATTATTAPATEPDATEPAAADEEPESGVGSRRVADENRKIWFVVAALIAVAVALSLLTLRYWHQTRPEAASAPADLDDDLVVATEAPPRGSDAPGRRSRRAVAGADHAEADEAWEPRGTGEHDRVEVPAATRSPRPSREQRAAAYQAAGRS